VVVLGELFKGTSWAGAQPVPNLFEAIANAALRVENGFLALERFDTAPLADVRQATVDLAEGYNQVLEAIRQLAQATNTPISYSQSRTAEQDEYYQRILRELFDRLCQARGIEQPATAASS